MKTRALLGRANDVIKREFTCFGGPMHGQKLWLSSTPTLMFCFKGGKGRYELPKMNGKTNLIWRKYG